MKGPSPDPKLREHLGLVIREGSVSGDPDVIGSFRTANPILNHTQDPSLVIRPSDAGELQGLIRSANQTGLNLTVASSTGPHCRGGFSSAKESVLIDLSHWRRIPWIDRRNRVCMIEPGVTYGELIKALEPYGMTVPMPLSPRQGKSVIASVMDREPSTWPNRQWDISDPVASTELIFGDGEVFRTGAAGGPGTLEQQRAAGGAQKSSQGPSQTDFHRVVQGSQGIMGIVTWITMRTELKATVQSPLLIGADSLEGLTPFIYEVQRQCLGEHSFVLDSTALAMLASAYEPGQFRDMRKSLPNYVCLLNVAGFQRMPKERVEYQLQDIRAIAGRSGVSLGASLGNIDGKTMLKMATHPTGEVDWRHRLKGHCLSLFFLTTLDRAPRLIEVFMDLASVHSIERGSVGLYLQPIIQNHACHVEVLCPFDPKNASEIELMRSLEREAVPRMAERGAFFSRPYGSAGEVVFGQNPQSYQVLQKTKRIFDPQGVLNSGKWGL